MKKLVFKYGIIGGLITTAWFNISEAVMPHNAGINARMLSGYASMIVAFALIFVAIKKYKDGEGKGHISFGKALGIGLLITLVASTVYVVAWLFCYYFFYPDYLDKYMSMMKAQMLAEGQSATLINKKIAEMNGYKAMYKNPVFNALFTYGEIMPVGVVISIIAALFLRSNKRSISLNV